MGLARDLDQDKITCHSKHVARGANSVSHEIAHHATESDAQPTMEPYESRPRMTVRFGVREWIGLHLIRLAPSTLHSTQLGPRSSNEQPAF
jgi:hypothetical protein